MIYILSSILIIAVAILFLLPFVERLSTLVGEKAGLRILRLRESRDFSVPKQRISDLLVSPPAVVEDPVIAIYGAGLHAQDLLRYKELHNFYIFGENKLEEIDPVCFIDDNPAKKGKIVSGLPVLGSLNDLPNIVEASRKPGRKAIKALVIAIAEIDKDKYWRAIRMCEEIGIRGYQFGFGFRRLDHNADEN